MLSVCLADEVHKMTTRKCFGCGHAFFPPSINGLFFLFKETVQKEDLPLVPSLSSGKKHCCGPQPSGGAEAEAEAHTQSYRAQIKGKYWSWKR